MSSNFNLVAALMACVGLSAPAWAEGDAANGEKLVKRCAACHSIKPGAPSKVGPNLYGVVGRISGSLPGYSYSQALTRLGAEGHVWTEAEIDRLLTDPRGNFPGNKMAFPGLKKPEDRADVIAYLVTQSAGAPDAAPPVEPAPPN